MKPYVYIVIRKDIKPCNYAPQIAHAALEAGYTTGRIGNVPDTSTHLVILQVADKMELEMVAMSLHEEGIAYEEFYEGFANMGLTALATLPRPKLEDSCMKSLELFSFN